MKKLTNTLASAVLFAFFAVGLLTTNVQADIILVDDFSTGSTPPIDGRVFDTRLDLGWRSTSGYGSPNTPSLWDITGGQMENPTATDPSGNGSAYTGSESPVWQWWTNPLAGTDLTSIINVSFDYSVGTGDTLTAHFWAVETGGTPTTTNTFITNNQGWINGNSGQNQGTSAGGNTPYNLADGTNAPSNTGNITGALTGTGTFTGTVDLSILGITGVSTIGDVDTFFFAFAMNEAGGGTTSVDNLILSTIPEPTSFAMFGLAIAGLGFRRRS